MISHLICSILLGLRWHCWLCIRRLALRYLWKEENNYSVSIAFRSLLRDDGLLHQCDHGGVEQGHGRAGGRADVSHCPGLYC